MNYQLRNFCLLIVFISLSSQIYAQRNAKGYTQGPIRHNSFHYEIVMITDKMIFSPQVIYERIFFEYPDIFISLSGGLGPYIGTDHMGATGKLGVSVMNNKHGLSHLEIGVDGLYVYDFKSKEGDIFPLLKLGARLEDIYMRKIRFKAGISIAPLQLIEDFKLPYNYLGAYIGFIHRL